MTDQPSLEVVVVDGLIPDNQAQESVYCAGDRSGVPIPVDQEQDGPTGKPEMTPRAL